MIEPKTISLITLASASVATSWFLTSTGVAVDTQTITIGGVVFTSVNAIGTTAGNVLVDDTASHFLDNLVDLINNPLVTNTKHVALSISDAQRLKLMGITATKTSATLMTLTSSILGISIVVSETETNFAWTTEYLSGGFSSLQGGKESLQFVAASITSGNGVFTVEVSNDGTNWVVYNRLTSNVTNTNGQTDTRVASSTLNSNTSVVFSIPDVFAFFRVRVMVTTDGVYSASAFIN